MKIELANTAIPYRSYLDITSNEPNLVLGSQNLLTSAKQLMERRPGFADAIESAITTFTNVKRHYWFGKWGGSDFYSIVNDITASTSDVYKLLVGTDASYVKIFSSASTSPFDFADANNTLFMGNGTDMRIYASGTTTKTWGGSRPSVVATLATTGTGISIYNGVFYRYTYEDSANGHETSSSDLSACSGIVSNKTIQVTVAASSNTRFDRLRVYRTTDGGSTNTSKMQEISGSPFTNTNQTINDTTTDANLGARICPGTTSNDPPTASSKLCIYGGRIFTAANATSYYSGLEELPSNGVTWECFPSGLGGNYYAWPQEVTSQAPMSDGVAVFTRGKVWKIEGDRRDNFRYPGILTRRGAVSHTAVAGLGNSVAWLDTASQVFLDGQEIGFDIRQDIKSIDHSQAYMQMHLSGRFHWLLLLDGANGKIYPYDMDTEKWLTPWTLPSASAALSSGEKSSGTVVLTCAIGKTKLYNQNATKFNDAGNAYSPVASLSLLKMAGQDESPSQAFRNCVVETDSNLASNVSYLLDDDPTVTSPPYVDISSNLSDPIGRGQGTNLVKTIYQPEGNPNGERVAVKITWPTQDQSFNCYTITINDNNRGG